MTYLDRKLFTDKIVNVRPLYYTQ